MKRALRRLAIYLFVFGTAAVISLQAQQASEESRPKFRSSTDMVTIQASVRDGRGRTVSGLRAEDFEVRDNGEIRRIVSLRSDRQSPLSVAILVDFSGSMRLPASREMARFAYDVLLMQLHDGRDEAALFTFDSELEVRAAFSTQLASLKTGLDEFGSFGTTALYDAAAAAAKQVAARSATHKAVVILTDGIDTASKLTPEQVSGIASSIDVPVCIVATGSPTDRQMLMERLTRTTYSESADLADLADWTGGQLTFASTYEETAGAVVKLVADLRQQYVIAIEAANTREWRRLDVRVKKKSARVTARSGYFGG